MVAVDLLSRIEQARLLIDGDVSECTDDELREALIRLETLGNSVQAMQAQVMVAMVRAAEAEDHRLDAARAAQSLPAPQHECRLAEFVADEVGVLLASTRVAATRRVATALDASAHPLLADAWRLGRLDARKVSEIAGGVAPLYQPDTVGMLAIEPLVTAAVEYSTAHTVTQLRAWLSRRVIAAAPEVAERRRAKAVADRRVTLTPLGDGVAELTAVMPAIQARQVFDTVNAVAHESVPGDLRTMDQRRSDALFDLLVGRAPPMQVSVQVVVPADVLAGESDEPGWVAGVGPVTAGTIRDLLGPDSPGRVRAPCGPLSGWLPPSSWRRLTCDPASGVLTDVAESQYRPSTPLDRAVRARDMMCRFPGCRRSAVGVASGTDLDHSIPWPEGRTTAANLAVLCRRHHRLKHTPGWQAEMQLDGTIVWTTPTGRQFRTEPWQHIVPPMDPEQGDRTPTGPRHHRGGPGP